MIIENSMSRRLIVVVDDEELVRNTVHAMLERSGYDVASFGSPKAALAFFNKKRTAIDLAIVDNMMPGMSGEQLGNEMKIAMPELPIIMVTGTPSGQHIKNVDAVLYKPILKLELLEAVRGLLP